MKKRKGSKPAFVIEIYLVQHGVQADVIEQGKECGSICRDFGGSYPVKDLKQQLGYELLDCVRKFALRK